MDCTIVLVTLIRHDYVGVATLSRLFRVSRRLDVALVRSRSLVLNRVESGRLCAHHSEPFVAALLARCVHTLMLAGTSGRVHTINLSRTRVKDVSALDGVAVLTLPDGSVRRV